MPCINCAFSLEDQPNQCMECDICFRNAALMSRKFKPVMYKGLIINRPLDMFISIEHKKILDAELQMTYEEGLKRRTLPVPPYPNTTWWPDKSQWGTYTQLIKYGSTKFSCDSSTTLTVTYTIDIVDQVQKRDLQIADHLGEIVGMEKKKEVPKRKVVSVDITDILKDMEGTEVGQDQ